jgi:acyl carrier protein
MDLNEKQLIDFLNETLELDDQVSEKTALFSSGLMDSVLMMNLILFVEEKAGKQVQQEDVTLENFDTPARIISYVESFR